MTPAGFEPALPKETDLKSVALDHSAKGMLLLNKFYTLSPAGFEPALPKETDLKSVALDHSAKETLLCVCCNAVSWDETALYPIELHLRRNDRT